jgi:hypothetical protein
MRRVTGFLVAVVVVHVGLFGIPARATDAMLIRGDANRDGRVSIADAARTLLYLGLAGPPPACLEAADTNHDGVLNLNDAILTMNVLYRGVDAIAAPFPECSVVTLGDLTCEESLGCAESVARVPGPHRISVRRAEGNGDATISGTPGKEVDIPIEVTLDTLDDGVPFGAYAWSLGLRIDSESLEASLVEPTFMGTRASQIFAGGYRHVAAVEGGVVSQIILSLTEGLTLPPGSSDVLKATLRVVVDPTGLEGIVTVSPSPMNGPGGSVELEVHGGSLEGGAAPFEPSIAPLTLRVVSARFIRGNSNLDETYDISDALHVLLALFEHGDGFPCEDASDANDDGVLDISDAVFTLGCLFLGSACPASDCVLDPSSDDLGCNAASPTCD